MKKFHVLHNAEASNFEVHAAECRDVAQKIRTVGAGVIDYGVHEGKTAQEVAQKVSDGENYGDQPDGSSNWPIQYFRVMDCTKN